MRKIYDRYKESGIEWIGKVPEHWTVKAIKHTFSFVVGFTPPTSKSEYYDNGIYDWVTISDMISPIVSTSKMRLSQKAIDETNKAIVPKGSLLYSFKLSVGKIAFAGKDIYTNEAIFSILPSQKYDLRFYFYALPEILIHNSNENIYGAKILNQELILNSLLPFPPISEQKKIADYLDYKCERINTLVEEKKQQIIRFNELRDSIISNAVIKGLDSKAPMRDSGVEWLGEIPAHWKQKKIGQISTKIGSGVTPKGGAHVYVDSGVMLIRSQNVFNDCLSLDNVVYISELVDEKMKNTRLNNNDVLLNITGASIGRCFVYKSKFGRANVNQHVCIIRTKSVDTDFLKYVIQSKYGQNLIDYEQNGSSREGLNFEQIKNFVIPFPELREQRKIVDYIDVLLNKIDESISILNSQIEKLLEYRQSLISEVVTGKIDVREWKAKK